MPRSRASPAFDRLLRWSVRYRLNAPARYLTATVTIILVAWMRAALFAGFAPWLLFTPAVLLVTLMLGQGAGAYATLLSAVLAALSLAGSGPLLLTMSQWIATAVFLLSTLGVVGVASELRAAFRRLEVVLAKSADDNIRIAQREAFLASVLGSSTDCIKVLDLDGKMTFMSEGGMKVMEIGDFNDIAGCPWPDFWQDDGNTHARNAIVSAREGHATSFIGQATTFKGSPRWWDVAVSPILGIDGTPERILSVSRDISASRENEEERNRLVQLVENSQDFIGMARLDGTMFFMNDAACHLVGLDRERLGEVSMADFVPADLADTMRGEILPAVTRDGSWSGELEFRNFATGELMPVLQTVFPVQAHDGTMGGYGIVTRDYRGVKDAQRQQELLNNELSHRLKNILTIVQAVASQTLRRADSLEEASTALTARLAALGTATDVLTAGAWSSADLRELATKALAPHGDVGERFRLGGPPVTISAQVALALTLALHELATNAIKYGALSNNTGHVALRWSIDEQDGGSAPRFKLSWEEIGGPEVEAPAKKGFGSTLIERSLQSYFHGETLVDYRRDGLVFRLNAPVSNALIDY